MIGIDGNFLDKLQTNSSVVTSEKFDKHGSLRATAYDDGTISVLDFDQFIEQHHRNTMKFSNYSEILLESEEEEDENLLSTEKFASRERAIEWIQKTGYISANQHFTSFFQEPVVKFRA